MVDGKLSCRTARRVNIDRDLPSALECRPQIEPEWLTLAAALCLGRMDDAARLFREAGPGELYVAMEAAAIDGKVGALAMLFDRGVDVNAHNMQVQCHATPLHNAVRSGSLASVRMLVEVGPE